MTVHARGYRPYAGAFGGPPAWWVILTAGVRGITRTRGMRILGVMFLLWFAFSAFSLYVQLGANDADQRLARRVARGLVENSAQFGRQKLIETLLAFYSGVTGLLTLLAIFTGAGLISEDLKARALTLVLVRPIRALDYAVGKALVVPWVLVTRTALPGVALWLAAGSWQPPGQTLAFWSANLDLLGVIGLYVLLASGLFSGTLLLVGAGTSRRGVVAALSAAVFFGGSMLAGIGAEVRGLAGELLRLAGLPMDAVAPFVRLEWAEQLRRSAARGYASRPDPEQVLPDPTAVALLAGALLLAGLVRVWLRARTVEVTE